jgi:NADH:ubiquinone oxidoreductase subunit 4 (subunit M)
LVGGYEFSSVIIFFSTFGMILSLIYSLFLYNRIFFGPLQKLFIRYYCDCSRLEFNILIRLVSLIIVGGLYPQIIFMFCLNTLFVSKCICLNLFYFINLKN